MTEQPPEAHEPEPMPEAAQPSQPAGLGSMPGPPPMPAAERVRLAAQQRGASDYAFSYWSALGWTVLTFGITGLCLMSSSAGCVRPPGELLDAAATVAWEQAGRQGLQQELAPSFPAGRRSAGRAEADDY